MADPLAAEMCTRDPRPAATLLLPYFEVDLTPPRSIDTLFTVRNAKAEPALVHVTLWTDWGLPTIDFPLFLTGFDQVEIDLADVFDGNLPVTADEQTDPDDSVSPHGDPAWDGSFPNCANFFPFNNPIIVGANRERLVDGHTGQPVSSIGQHCLGQNVGDGLARGYVTLDNVSRCDVVFPSDAGFFGAGGVARSDNQLWGEFTLVAGTWRDSAPLVAIEADPAFTAVSTPTQATFYGRFTQLAGGNDHREPLGAAGFFPFRFPDWEDEISDILVWRDSTAGFPPFDGYVCATGPPWRPLGRVDLTCFDEEEDAVEVCTAPGACLTLATQRAVANNGLSLPFDRGFCRYDLGIPADSFPGDVDFPGSGGTTAQSHVLSLVRSPAAASLRRGTVVRQACEAPGVRHDVSAQGGH